VRLPEVELEIPVLVQGSETPDSPTLLRGGAAIGDMRKKFDEMFVRWLSRAGPAQTPEERRRVRIALDQRVAALGPALEVGGDTNQMADELTAAAVGALRVETGGAPSARPAIPEEQVLELKESVRKEFVRLRTAPPRLTVLVTSAEIREAATQDNLTRMRLKITEQGVEWTSVESNGVRQDRLIPE